MSQTKNFYAEVHSGTTGYLITVKGDVNCGMLDVQPRLSKKDPQGINEKILILDVYPASDSPNGSFRSAEYNENIESRDTYTEVQLIDLKGTTVETIPVK